MKYAGQLSCVTAFIIVSLWATLNLTPIPCGPLLTISPVILIGFWSLEDTNVIVILVPTAKDSLVSIKAPPTLML